jgi:hypothetical protein
MVQKCPSLCDEDTSYDSIGRRRSDASTVADNARGHPSLAPQTPDEVFGTHNSTQLHRDNRFL